MAADLLLRFERAHDAVAAVDPGDDLVRPVADRRGDPHPDVVVELLQPAVELGEDVRVAHPAHQHRRIAALAHPFELDRVFAGRREARAGYPHRLVRDLLVARLAGIERAGRLAQVERVGVFVERVRGDALRAAAVVLAQRKHVERVVVHHRHHAVRRDPMGDRRGAAFQDLGHVPDDRRVVTLHQRQRGENRGVAAAAADHDFRALRYRRLDRLDPHHADDVQRGVDVVFGQRRRRRQRAGPAGAQMLAHGVLRQFGMDRRQLEMQAAARGRSRARCRA